MKKRFLFYLIMVFALVFTFNLQAEGDINININGQNVYGDASPIVVNDRTLVPVRLVSENLGLAVNWDQATQEVTLSKEGTEIKFIIGSKSYQKNGVEVAMDIAPQVYKERTYLPIRVIGECLDKKVDWDQSTKTVLIMDKDGAQNVAAVQNLTTQATTTTQNTNKTDKTDTKIYNQDNGDILAYLKADGRIIGNIKSKIYHLKNGLSYQKVSLKNAVFFNTEEEAIKAGYRRAKN